MTARTLCGQGIALASAASPARPRRPRLILVATILASSMDYVDSSVVNVGLPAIGRSLHGDAADLQWVVNAYLLPLSALLLLGGALGDRFGRRRMLLTGLGLFAAGSTACALAISLPWLIAARVALGLAAALMLPNSLAILGGAFVGVERSRAVGLWAASASIAAAAGPILGGWFVDTVGWRAIFLINLPLAAAAAACALYAVPGDERQPKPAHLDLSGAALITTALGGLIWGLTESAGAAGWRAPALAAVAAGLGFGAAFVWIEQRKGERAMTPLALFASKPLVALSLLTLLLYGAMSGFMLLVPYLLITTLGYSATAAGAALLPFPMILALVSPLMGDLAGRIGPRIPLIGGAALVAAGFLLALLAGRGGGYWTSILPSVAVVALGMACVAAPLTTAVLSLVDAGHTGAASGLNSALAQLGGVVAIALIGGVLATHGAGFIRAFDGAVVVGAVAALAAGACVVLLFEGVIRPS